MRFTRKFKIPHKQAALDFVDIDSKVDLPLFFDPNVFMNEEDLFSQKCAASLQSYFETLIDCIKHSKRSEAEVLLGKLSEPNEVCLGWSKGQPSGRGIGKLQAKELYDRLSKSEAARSGMITDLADCEVFVEGIGPDKISDITANIIRVHLIEYTQEQCNLHNVSGLQRVPMGGIWSSEKLKWEDGYFDLPVINGKPILLVPKRFLRWTGDLSRLHQKYYKHFALNFLKEEALNSNSSLVKVIKSKKKKSERRVVYKKDLEKEYPLSKDFLFRFSRDNPQVFDAYKKAYQKTARVSTRDLEEDFDTESFCDALIAELKSIPAGTEHADHFHRFMVGALEFIFHPNFSNPVKEASIHGGRKRIDIRYNNCADDGFFHWIHSHKQVTALYIVVECKNYSSDPQNPELDQISGRFSANRGRIGLLVARKFDNRKKFLERCRDTASDGRGFVIPLVDQDIIGMLGMIRAGKRSEIDSYLGEIFGEIA